MDKSIPVYIYNTATGEYLREEIAFLDPITQDGYMIPPDGTITAPPEVTSENTAAFYNASTGSWEIKADFRGTVIYRKSDQMSKLISVAGETIPEDYTDIRPENSTDVWDGSKWDAPFELKKEAKRKAIWAAGDNELYALKANYTQAEIESWSKQEQGAKDYAAGNTTTDAAVFVATIADTRGIETQTLVEKILTNVTGYGIISAKVIGQQQKLDKLIDMCATEASLASIVWTPIIGGLA